jgi:hypothetical protein
MIKPTPVDPQALKDPRPDQSDDNNFFTVYTNSGDGILGTQLQTFAISCNVGTVEVTTS